MRLIPFQQSLRQLEILVSKCDRCPELRDYCERVGRTKRRAFADDEYWSLPVPSFGDHAAKILIVGLAPAAHGANRTGRMFTGDRSGEFLYAALHRAHLANQAHSTNRHDGLALRGAYITAAARCAPPANKPSPEQLRNCRSFLVDEMRMLQPRVVLCLGAIAWRAALDASRDLGLVIPSPMPRFAHGAELELAGFTLIGCYHVSQQNTFTGRLTSVMIDQILARAIDVSSALEDPVPG